MKKIAVAKLKVTLKLEDTLPAFYVGLHTPHHDKRSCPHGNFFPHTTSYSLKYINDFSNISIVSPLISTIFHYIDASTQDIDLPTTFDTQNAQHTLSPSNLLPNSTIKKIINRIASIFNATYATLKTT